MGPDTIGEMKFESGQGKLVVALPVTINNTGRFEISEFRIVAFMKDSTGMKIAYSETVFERIPSGLSASKTLNMSLSISDLIRGNLTHLLFNDSEVMMDLGLGMRYAGLFGFNVCVPFGGFPWGAPFNDIQMGSPSAPQPIPGKSDKVSVSLRLQFKNNSPICINGAVYMILYDDKGNLFGSGNETVTVEPDTFFSEEIRIELDSRTMQNFTGKGYLEIKFVAPSFAIDFPRVEYG
jgi:hypothetical protein